MTSPVNDATRRQIEAANPQASTWLSANAGSGKTRVLTDRVARLLLDRVMPQRILCLTYTKAAASEMQNRLFKRLGSWAMKSNDALRAELDDLGAGHALSDDDLANARTLFARAIETPGGLKIQTIHSFCASLLRRFPLEAGVSPQFRELDERASNLLIRDVLELIAQGPDRDAFDGLVKYYTEEDLVGLIANILKYRDAFMAMPTQGDIWSWFELGEGFDEQALMDSVFLGDEDAALSEAVTLMAGSDNKTDVKAADVLHQWIGAPRNSALLESMCSTLLSGSGSKSPFSSKFGATHSGLPTKKLVTQQGDALRRLESLMQRVEAARNLRNGLTLARRTQALHHFARAFIPAFEARKQLLGVLDFDDLIHRARLLLTDPNVAQWVLYRLDGGIDHILLDEAQDTSPDQWRVIQLLAQEFTSGEGAREVDRTIFVVGDVKQSIYSFQGADPSGFTDMSALFKERLEAIGKTFQELSLDFSFRSSPAILRFIDQVFDVTKGGGVGGPTKHLAFHDAMPGRVDLWSPVEKEESEDPKDWSDPVDAPAANHHFPRLARDIAREIKRMTKEEWIGSNAAARPVRFGDILILVRGRQGIFKHLIRACKQEGVEIAGADVLVMNDELGVRDILAVLAFLNTSDDDLSLASALRSPLFGWSEAQLYDLAHERGRSQLWRELYERRAEFPETFEVLNTLRDNADYLRPFELIEMILTRFDGRRKLIARLGIEAEDGIDALLDQALTYEMGEVPSLAGFLGWLASEEVKIKRQPDTASDQVRVMTVHGSKGLEAPIVFMPDTHKPRALTLGKVSELGAGQAIWTPRSEDQPDQTVESLAAAKQQLDDERRRLLYVAASRAEKWLIVAGAGDLGGDDTSSWYNILRSAMVASGARAINTPVGTLHRFEHGTWPLPASAAGAADAPAPAHQAAALPDWLRRPAASPQPGAPLVSPSKLGGAKALGGAGALDDEDAMARGSQLHLLLEHLPLYPIEDWPEIAQSLLSSDTDTAEDATVIELLDEASAVLENPDLAFLFGENALSEAEITAPLPSLQGRQMLGKVDCLLVEADRVLVVDFKSNAVVPDLAAQTPVGLLRQMGAYAEALGALYPTKNIELAILWTRTGKLMSLPHDMVMQALHSTATY
ncbi:ATP-dependent helicase/nuclease subunit A [Aquimixticola soesokkakensis]|uniref:DNA 3'-5' helicase n=1 Tax=Aquimixticola soesokkakensis TaxID=1519096 RepID=A0A1Y5RA70_9RHOB|nr:double-strand break repair helicase AddA [Aquimixticola soesokkakensis]SLN12004.1 ATP-dependent helicase/nuclease subunit A [Aquimixticola soesokkakensis]